MAMNVVGSGKDQRTIPLSQFHYMNEYRKARELLNTLKHASSYCSAPTTNTQLLRIIARATDRRPVSQGAAYRKLLFASHGALKYIVKTRSAYLLQPFLNAMQMYKRTHELNEQRYLRRAIAEACESDTDTCATLRWFFRTFRSFPRRDRGLPRLALKINPTVNSLYGNNIQIYDKHGNLHQVHYFNDTMLPPSMKKNEQRSRNRITLIDANNKTVDINLASN